MFSLENFYYILYTNLFKPARIRLNYFSPFGSTSPDDLTLFHDNIAPYFYVNKHHILFYDQEPLLKENVKKLITSNNPYRIFNKGNFKFVQILANSEISEFKNNLCKDNNYLDLYYFFHGFAALTWYRDYKYFSENYNFTKKFMSLNHLTSNDRSYRLFLISELIKKNIHHEGVISLHTTSAECLKELNSADSKLSYQAKQSIRENLLSVNLPMIADTATPVGSLSADVGVTEHKFHQSAFWHIITETVFYYPKLHLTEKIFRPIVNKRPFMLVGAPGNLAYLKRYGFKTFNQWIDESYDQELDNDRRIELITEQVEKISRLSLNELRAMQKEMSDILEFNFNHFYGDFRKIITHELLNNFKTCIQQWNHGKFDRTIDIESLELDKVKKLLLS